MADPAPETASLGVAATSLAVVLWGLGNVLVKHLAIDGLSLAVDRVWIGACLYLIVHYLRGGRISWPSLRLSIVGGACFAADIALFFVALHHTSVADATIIGALQPALAFGLAGPLFGEVVGAREIGLSLLATVGVAIAVLGSAPTAGRTLFGDLLAVGALFTFTWYFVASKQARAVLGAFEYQTCMLIVAVVALTPAALLTGHDVVPRHASDFGWAAVVALVPGGGHLLVNWAHRSTPIMLTSLLTLGIPVVAVGGAALLLGEPLTAIQVIGAVIALGAVGLVLVLSSSTRPATAVP